MGDDEEIRNPSLTVLAGNKMKMRQKVQYVKRKYRIKKQRSVLTSVSNEVKQITHQIVNTA